jgi:ferredoxin
MTDSILSWFFVVMGAIHGIFWLGFAWVSLREVERRAAVILLVITLCGSALWFSAAWLPALFQQIFLGLVGLCFSLDLLLCLLPGKPVDFSRDVPLHRYDERDILFARARLQPGSSEYQAYYSLRPEKQVIDDGLRARAGLLSPHSALANPLLFSSPQASFTLTEVLRPVVEGVVAAERQEYSPAQMTTFIRGLAHYYGALDVGIAIMQPYHYYSHVGRGIGDYGEPIEPQGMFGIAITVEMDYAMIQASPYAPGVMESARQYVESARVAVQLAAAIRQLGYPARAHIDGNYRVICPLVARDAGLGEIGRMGLLMTPSLGPRVRLAMVTTDLPLVADARKQDGSVINFCTQCKKCAECCPAHCIPLDDRREIGGALRWQIDAEACYRYWTGAGTDCGRCMAVCPYSHPGGVYHDLVRWGNSHSAAFRRAAIVLDNLFYGRKPLPKPAPSWTHPAGS